MTVEMRIGYGIKDGTYVPVEVEISNRDGLTATEVRAAANQFMRQVKDELKELFDASH